MTDRVVTLERRLQAIELALGDRAVLEGQLRMAPEPGAQRGDLGEPMIVLHARPAKALHKSAAKSAKPGKQSAPSLAGARFADAKR